MKLSRKAGATSEIWQVFIRDSSSTTGAGLTGLVFNSGSLTAYYHRDTDTTATAISLVTMTVGTFTSLGFKEVDATNLPGVYQFCPPNAAIAAGAKSCIFMLKGAANMAPLPIEVDLFSQVDVVSIAGTAQTAKDLGALNVTGLNTLASHDPGTTIGTSTLTQAQVTGGAYSIQSSSCVLGDARIANLDTTVSSRGTSTLTQTQVTGGSYNIQSSSCVLGDGRIAHLDADMTSRTKPADTQAAVTLVTTVTNLTAKAGSIKINTSYTFSFTMVDSSGAPQAGKTVTAQTRLDSGSRDACSNAVSELSVGDYKIQLAQAETNGSEMVDVYLTASGCVPLHYQFWLVP